VWWGCNAIEDDEGYPHGGWQRATAKKTASHADEGKMQPTERGGGNYGGCMPDFGLKLVRTLDRLAFTFQPLKIYATQSHQLSFAGQLLQTGGAHATAGFCSIHYLHSFLPCDLRSIWNPCSRISGVARANTSKRLVMYLYIRNVQSCTAASAIGPSHGQQKIDTDHQHVAQAEANLCSA